MNVALITWKYGTDLIRTKNWRVFLQNLDKSKKREGSTFGRFTCYFFILKKSSLPIQKKTAYFKYCIVLCKEYIFKFHVMIKRRFEGVKTSRIFVTVTLFFSSALKPYLLRICLRCKGQLISKTKFKVFIWTKKINENISEFLPYLGSKTPLKSGWNKR